MNSTDKILISIIIASFILAVVNHMYTKHKLRREIEREYLAMTRKKTGKRVVERGPKIRRHASSEPNGWRGWLTINDPDYMRKGLDAHLEAVWSTRAHVHGVGFKLHLGDRGSETPLDINFYFYWVAFFFTFNTPNMGKFFEKIGRGHKRDISLYTHGGKLWWKMWWDDDNGSDRDVHRCDGWRNIPWWPFKDKHYRGWACLREGNLDLNPIDALYGMRYYSYETLAVEDDVFGVYQWPEDVHEVTYTLERGFRQRRRGPKWARKKQDVGLGVDWMCEAGIPVRNDYWKGDCVYASSIKVDSEEGWLGKADEALKLWVLKERERYGYKPPLGKIEDIKMTDEGLVIAGSVWDQEVIDNMKAGITNISVGFGNVKVAAEEAAANLSSMNAILATPVDGEQIDVIDNEKLKSMYTPEEILTQAENRDKED